MDNIAQSLIGDLEPITVANPGGVQVVRPTFPAIKYSMKMKLFGLDETKLFHFHKRFKINEIKSTKQTHIFYTYEPPFQEYLIHPCIRVFTWKIRSFERFKQPLFCPTVLRSFVKINLFFRIVDPLKLKSPDIGDKTYYCKLPATP